MDRSAPSPDAAAAERIVEEFFGEPARSCVRFATGLRHWVYDVTLESGRRVVARLSHSDHRDELAGGVFWHERLASVGVPVAEVLGFDVDTAQPFMLLERLAGTDIGNVVDVMTAADVAAAAQAVAEMQLRAAELPAASGFGYALGYDATLRSTWREVLDDNVDRARSWIEDASVVDVGWADRVAATVDRRSSLVSVVEPTAFLHDATTKNVIVDVGRVTGLVDVDQMAFGDPLWAVSLTRMSLVAAGRSTTYADDQVSVVSSRPDAPERMDLYTTIHCLSFLGELGQEFNRDEAASVDEQYQARLEDVLSSLLQR